MIVALLETKLRPTASQLEAWRTLPEHLAAQRRGHEEFYDSVSIQVCDSIRQHDWRADGS